MIVFDMRLLPGCLGITEKQMRSDQTFPRMFKGIRVKYRLSIKRFSTHSLRKTFAKRVYTMAGNRSEDALVRLSEMLGHSSTAITRKYIGLTQQVMADTYDMLSY